MGGNSPSHFPQEQDAGGGLTLLKGIQRSSTQLVLDELIQHQLGGTVIICHLCSSSISKRTGLSDKVIKRMKASPTPSPPQPPQAQEPPPPSAQPDPSPSAGNLTSPPPPPAPHPPPPKTSSSPAPPVTFYAPPPERFHSYPPTFVQEPTIAAPPLSASLAPPPPPAAASPEADASVEHIPAPRAAAGTEPPVSPPPVQATAAPPPASEPVTATPPAATEPASVAPPAEPLVPSMPQLEVTLHQPSAQSPEVEPVVPPCPASQTLVEPAVVPLHGDPPLPEPAPPSPPQPPAAPSYPAEVLNEEAPPRGHVVELPVLPPYTPPGEPLVDPPAPPPPAEGPTMSLFPVVEDEAPAITSVPPPTEGLTVSPEVLEEELREKMEEMQRRLEEEISQRREQLQRQLEEIKVQVQAEAKAAAQAQVEEEVKKTLEAERAAHMETLTNSIMKERIKTGDQRLKLQLYRLELKAQQLEEREKKLEKRDVLHKDNIARLEAKYAEFKRATAEAFEKGKEEAESRFTRFSFQPVCGDLQSQILKCYRENPGKTLDCSSIASAYLQCVDHAKKNKLSTRG